MKILLIANKDVTLYLARREFIETLIKLNHKVFILCPYGEKLAYFESIGATLINYKIDRRGMNPIKEIKLIVIYRKVLKSIRPDYTFTYTIKPNLYTGLIANFINVKYFPTVTGLGSSISNRGFKKFLISILMKLSFKNAEAIFFQSQHNKSWYEQEINNKTKTILVNGSGVNLVKYNYFEPEISKITTFLFLGRIMKEKGIDELLYAAQLLKIKYGDLIQIKIAGFLEDKYYKKLSQMQDKNIIEYLGFVDDTYQIIRLSSAIVLPSYHEGLSNVLLEAQAVGRPVIASKISGCIETFIDGESGYSVKEKNGDDLFLQMEKFHLLSFELKQKMGRIGRNHVEKNFNRDDVLKKYLSIIK